MKRILGRDGWVRWEEGENMIVGEGESRREGERRRMVVVMHQAHSQK